MTITNSKAIGGIKDKGGIGIGYSLGFQAQYAIHRHLFLRSGFTYQSNGYRHIMENLVFPTDIINGTTSTLQNDIIVSSIGIPIDFGCLLTPKKGRLSYLLGLGGVLNLHVGTKSKGKILHEKIEDDDFNGSNKVDGSIYSLVAFTGVEIRLTKQMILGIEPTLRFTPNKFVLAMFDSEGKSGVESGLKIRLRFAT